MRFDHDYNRAENACRVGLALALVAIALNTLSLYHAPGGSLIDIIGILAGVSSMACAYFGESVPDSILGDLSRRKFGLGCVGLTVASYAIWLINFFQ